jgi:hypothetical protein
MLGKLNSIMSTDSSTCLSLRVSSFFAQFFYYFKKPVRQPQLNISKIIISIYLFIDLLAQMKEFIAKRRKQNISNFQGLRITVNTLYV